MGKRAWAPGHATLFFAVPQQFEDPKLMGSIGAGLNFSSGIVTTVERASEDQVYWNNEKISGNVSLTALDLIRKEYGLNATFLIKHSSELEIGVGLSTSGAGALGTVLAINTELALDLASEQLFRIAHVADAINHTGLGSVVGQTTGGIELRMTQGNPNIAQTMSHKSNSKVALLILGPLKTSEILVSSSHMSLVTKTGKIALERALQIKTNHLREFVQIGREFTMDCGLATDRVKSILRDLEDIGETDATMAMIGETVIVVPEDLESLVRWAHSRRLVCTVTQITNRKPMIIP